MKRLLLTLALTLSASAHAFAQSGGLERRVGDALVGPVREARIETANYVRRGGELVEEPRHVSSIVSYTPDGKRCDQREYADDGATLIKRFVQVYDDAGRVAEHETYDWRDRLLEKVVFRFDEGETLTYDGEGNLKQRVVTEQRDGGVTETRRYGASGALLSRSVIERGESGATMKSYDAYGALRGETTVSRRADGAHVSEYQSYDAGGAPTRRRVSTADARSGVIDTADDRPDRKGISRIRQTREYDARGNLSKLVVYVWDKEAGDYVPSYVSYYTVTYYR